MENHMYRGNIGPGSRVKIILKKDQKSGKLTEGYVDRILTNRPVHTRGIKVMLKDGQVGRGSMDLNVIYIMVGSKIKTGDMLYQSDNKKESWEIFQRDYRLGEVELDRLKYGLVVHPLIRYCLCSIRISGLFFACIYIYWCPTPK